MSYDHLPDQDGGRTLVLVTRPRQDVPEDLARRLAEARDRGATDHDAYAALAPTDPLERVAWSTPLGMDSDIHLDAVTECRARLIPWRWISVAAGNPDDDRVTDLHRRALERALDRQADRRPPQPDRNR